MGCLVVEGGDGPQDGQPVSIGGKTAYLPLCDPIAGFRAVIRHLCQLTRPSTSPAVLLTANYDLFNEYDRAVGEAEFRTYLAYALVGLTAALSWLQSPRWALLLVVSARLYAAGVGCERVANDVIIQAVVAVLVTPVSLSGAAAVPAVPAGGGQ